MWPLFKVKEVGSNRVGDASLRSPGWANWAKGHWTLVHAERAVEIRAERLLSNPDAARPSVRR
jgi:hypothetical protein